MDTTVGWHIILLLYYELREGEEVLDICNTAIWDRFGGGLEVVDLLFVATIIHLPHPYPYYWG